MIVNVGGFGHTGNTALLDLLIDTGQFAPVARDFSETSILRGRWCIWGMLRALDAGATSIKLDFFSDALLGIVKEEHKEFSPPVIHDFSRNARVLSLYGDGYRRLVDELVARFEEALNKRLSREIFIKQAVTPFYDDLSSLVRSSSSTTYALSRNDPAGYDVALLESVEYVRHISVIRNPLDVAFEWCHFYHKKMDQLTIKQFASQFCNKIDRFTKGYNLLSEEKKNKVAIVAFEDVATSPETRHAIFRLLDIIPNESQGRFDPKKSCANIGVGDVIDNALKIYVNDVCGRKYNEFIERFSSVMIGV